MGENAHRGFFQVEHVHFYGFYIGNYPGLDQDRIIQLTALLNALPTGAAQPQA
jgi:CDP-6-deoxy-D-xylo-4-hexulose-3-dehydrase